LIILQIFLLFNDKMVFLELLNGKNYSIYNILINQAGFDDVFEFFNQKLF